jgi:purine-binding chemotaxis protein CheW
MEENATVKKSVLQEFVSFMMTDKQVYAVDVNYIETINEKMDIRPVPLADDYIEGVINLRGRIVPIINLSKKINMVMDESEQVGYNKIIVVKYDNNEMGFLVNDVKEVIRVNSDEIEQVNSTKHARLDQQYIHGIVNRNGRLIVVLSIKAIMNSMGIVKEEE